MTLVGKAGLLTGFANKSVRGGDVIKRGRDVIISFDDVTRSGCAGSRGSVRSFRVIFSRDDFSRVELDAFSVRKVFD